MRSRILCVAPPLFLLSLLSLLFLLAACAPRPLPDAGGPESPALKPWPEPEGLCTLDGAPTSLAAQRRPVTVLVFWATHCKPCMQELPQVAALQQRYAADPEVAVLSIDVDESEDSEVLARVRAVAGERAPGLLVLHDSRQQLWQNLCGEYSKLGAPSDAAGDRKQVVQLLPLLAVMDREARLHLRAGFEDQSETAFVDGLTALIDQARRGALPPSEPLPDLDSKTVPAEGEWFAFRLPAEMTREQRLAEVDKIRELLQKNHPYLGAEQLDDLVRQIASQLEQGRAASVQVPPPAARPEPGAQSN